jgi:hypothetical protein
MTPESEIRRHLDQRGLELQSVRRIWFTWKLLLGRGVSNLAVAYEATATARDGSLHRYTYAWDPAGGSVFERSGLKRFANGVSFDADL